MAGPGDQVSAYAHPPRPGAVTDAETAASHVMTLDAPFFSRKTTVRDPAQGRRRGGMAVRAVGAPVDAGPGAADRYPIMAGRLDMQREVVEGVLAGQYYYFPDAVNPAPVPLPPFAVPITEREILELRIMGSHRPRPLHGTPRRHRSEPGALRIRQRGHDRGPADRRRSRLPDLQRKPGPPGRRRPCADVRGPRGRPPDRRRVGRVSRRRRGSPDAPDCLKQG